MIVTEDCVSVVARSSEPLAHIALVRDSSGLLVE